MSFMKGREVYLPDRLSFVNEEFDFNASDIDRAPSGPILFPFENRKEEFTINVIHERKRSLLTV